MSRLAVLLLSASLSIAACGDDPVNTTSNLTSNTEPDTTEEPDRATPDMGETGRCASTLNILSGQTQRPTAGQDTELAVRYADCFNTPVVGGNVSFEIIGDPGDSRLAATNMNTDELGEVSVILTAGFDEVSFSVEASALNADPVIFDITINARPNGDIEAHMTYAGEHTLSAFTMRVWDGRCENVDPFTPTGALHTAVPVTTVGAPARVAAVLVGSDYAVSLHAAFDGNVLAYACVEPVEVTSGQTTIVDVTLADLPITYNGVFELENEFDMADALPPSISDTVHLFHEMGDDDDVNGNFETDDYGVDPAAFLLDFVYSEFCCWEATGGDFNSCNAQEFTHRAGDLEQMYTRDFATWSGAQPVSRFMCGILAYSWGANQAIQTEVQGLIVDSVPDVLLRILTLTSDLSGAFTEMQITSQLTIVEVDENKEGNFTHELQTMTVELHDLSGTLHTFEFALSEAGLSNEAYTGVTSVVDDRLQIPEHTFRVDFGRLLQYIYLNLLLPLLECDADGDGTTEACESTADLFATWIDCEAVGAWIEAEFLELAGAVLAEIFPMPSSGAALCRAGVNVGGLYVEGLIADSVDTETLMTLSGSTIAGEINDRLEAQTLIEGVWTGVLEEGEDYSEGFDGVFEGVLLDEE